MNEMVYMDYDLKLICCLFFAIIILLIIRRILIDKLTSEDLEISIRSVLGREEIQEDYMNIIERPYGTLAILADGFGKNEAGKTASKVAVNFITEMFIKENSSNKIAYFFKKALMKANHEVIESTQSSGLRFPLFTLCGRSFQTTVYIHDKCTGTRNSFIILDVPKVYP